MSSGVPDGVEVWRLVGVGEHLVPHVLRGPNLGSGEPVDVIAVSDLDKVREQGAEEERERLKAAVQPALDSAREDAGRINHELSDYAAYSSAEDLIQTAEAALDQKGPDQDD